MNYPTGQKIKIGDRVIADGMTGVVVCDFDSREFLEGYAGWDMPDVEMLGGGRLNGGIMIKQKKLAWSTPRAKVLGESLSADLCPLSTHSRHYRLMSGNDHRGH